MEAAQVIRLAIPSTNQTEHRRRRMGNLHDRSP
jgi:hypothetical protein